MNGNNRNQEQSTQTTLTPANVPVTASPAAIIFRNVLGAIAGVVAFIVTYFISAVVFEFIIRIPLLGWILSFPLGPSFYAVLGTLSAAQWVAMGVSAGICIPTKNWRAPGLIAMAALMEAAFIFFTITEWIISTNITLAWALTVASLYHGAVLLLTFRSDPPKDT